MDGHGWTGASVLGKLVYATADEADAYMFADVFFVFFYRAKLCLARYCHGMLSVRLSVCPSVCDVEVS